MEDVFGVKEKPHFGVFYTNAEEPLKAPETLLYEFSLPPIEFPDNDSEKEPSILETRHQSDQTSIRSLGQQSDDQALDWERAPIESECHGKIREGKLCEAPTVEVAIAASKDIQLALRRKSKGKGGGYVPPKLDSFVRSRMEGMKAFLSLYTNSQSATYRKWVISSHQAAIALGHDIYCARQLRSLARAYIADQTVLPLNPYGEWNESMLIDEDLCVDINLHLQELGNKITAEKLVNFLARPEVKEKHGINKTISVRTARRYLNTLGFRFTHAKKGQYTDGHERDDVIRERTLVFIPKWKTLESRMRNWRRNNVLEIEDISPTPEKRVVVWFHDETIFYANDRRRLTWYHKDADAKPYAKGDGASLMISDVISADYGFLKSRNGNCTARQIFKPGKNRDGYLSNDDILEQFRGMVAIAKSEYPNDHHVFVYDNATTHLKRPENAPSARHMPKFTPKPGNNWLVDVTRHDANGRAIKKADGTVEKTKVRMANTKFNDQVQSLYFPEQHPRANVFKGMQVILQERGHHEIANKNAQCKDFKCPPGVRDCCCRRFLYTEPDFAQGESNLEILAKELGVEVMFLPKFHCELNPIEQCWGYAKRVYRLNPESSREDQLEKNALAALKEVDLLLIRRCVHLILL